MQQIVLPDHFRLGIGKNRKGETELLPVSLARIGRISADRHDANAALIEFGKSMLKTPQLGVA